jgi:hypothetical protein
VYLVLKSNLIKQFTGSVVYQVWQMDLLDPSGSSGLQECLLDLLIQSEQDLLEQVLQDQRFVRVL